mmetsp:Transcript_21622/g.35075  ORF Transcript_21622/g.35075 Transcript_21622/m.35075 type:complete len:311 (-) Transcript_21622:112-1044(-)
MTIITESKLFMDNIFLKTEFWPPCSRLRLEFIALFVVSSYYFSKEQTISSAAMRSWHTSPCESTPRACQLVGPQERPLNSYLVVSPGDTYPRTKSIMVNSAFYVSLSVYKTVLAWKGLGVAVDQIGDAYKCKPLAQRAETKQVLYAYVVLQLIDEAKSILDGDHWTSHAHHVLTGIGFLADATVGTSRTQTLASMTLVSELVAPAYQAYSYLKRKPATKLNKLLMKLSVWAAIVITFAQRIPFSLFILYISLRDSALALSSNRKRATEEEKKHLDQIQPTLLLPASGAALFILYLDYTWMRHWALPKITN